MQETNLTNNIESIADFVECLAETLAIVGCVHERESEQSFLFNPLALWHFLDPVSSDSKVAISV
jgi:hypothetical protein